jgi:hypothetical protein
MIDGVFVVPLSGGLEDPFGEQVPFRCKEDDSVQVLFDAMRERLGESVIVRLSLEAALDDVTELRALDPFSATTAVAAGIQSGSRVIVGYTSTARKDQR